MSTRKKVTRGKPVMPKVSVLGRSTSEGYTIEWREEAKRPQITMVRWDSLPDGITREMATDALLEHMMQGLHDREFVFEYHCGSPNCFGSHVMTHEDLLHAEEEAAARKSSSPTWADEYEFPLTFDILSTKSGTPPTAYRVRIQESGFWLYRTDIEPYEVGTHIGFDDPEATRTQKVDSVRLYVFNSSQHRLWFPERIIPNDNEVIFE